MAILKGSNLKLSGKFGNSVIRVMDGQVVVSAKPTHYKKPTDKDSLKRNDDFLFCTKLASAVRKMTSISQLWSMYRKKKGIYQVILSENKLLIGNSSNRSNIQIAPAESILLPVVIKEVIPGDDKIIITINPLSEPEDIVRFYEPTLLGNMILCGANPVSKKERYIFIPVLSEYKASQVNEEISFSFQPAGYQLDEFNSFPERCIYLTFITLGRSGEPVKSSPLFSWKIEDQ